MNRNIARLLLVVALVLVLPSLTEARVSDGDFIKLCVLGSHAQVQAAIRGGANVNARSEIGWSPLHAAAYYNVNSEIIALLIKAGAKVNPKGLSATPLHLAAEKNPNPEVTSLLLKAGANVNTKAYRLNTPLHSAAAMNPNPEVLIVLLNAGADVNARNINGWTPLHAAASYSNPMVVTILLKAGADVNARNKDGERPIDLAQYNESLKGTPAYWALHDASF